MCDAPPLSGAWCVAERADPANAVQIIMANSPRVNILLAEWLREQLETPALKGFNVVTRVNEPADPDEPVGVTFERMAGYACKSMLDKSGSAFRYAPRRKDHALTKVRHRDCDTTPLCLVLM